MARSLQSPIANDGDLVRSSDGALWYTENGAFVRTVRNGTTREFTLPATANVSLLTPGPHGTLWFLDDVVDPEQVNTPAFIGRITPRGAIKLFRLPFARPDTEGSLQAMAEGPDGDIYFVGGDYNKSEHTSAYVGQVTVRGQIRLFTLPQSLSPGATFQPEDTAYWNTTQSMVAGPMGRSGSPRTRVVCRASPGLPPAGSWRASSRPPSRARWSAVRKAASGSRPATRPRGHTGWAWPRGRGRSPSAT